MRLFVVRHGRTSWNVAGRAQGHTDVPLDDVGLEQVALLGEAFRSHRFERILTSDLQRAVQTAEAIQATTGACLTKTPNLRERCFGEWEGIDFETFGALTNDLAVQQGVSPFEMRPPGGESFLDVWNRLGPIVQEVENAGENLLIVSHGVTSGLLLARIMRGSIETCRSFRLGNTAVTELERRRDGFYFLVRYADMSHLNQS
jgi:broad specificity phosphatase PhoE